MKLIKLRQFAACISITVLSISCTGELSIEVQDWITLPDEELELDIKNRVETVTVSSKVAWTAASDVDWLVIKPSSGYTGETEVTITSTFEEDKETSGAIVFNSSQAGNFKETRLSVKHETLVADWITLPGKTVELDMKNNSKTVTISSKVNWTAVSDSDWLVFEPSKGNAGETEVKITSKLNEDKENSGTIMFISNDAGNLKDIPLTVTQTTLITDWITLPEKAVELDIKNNSSIVTITSETAWTATSGVDWLTLEPSSGNAGTTEVKITSTLNKDKEASGAITFNSSEEGHFKAQELRVNTVLSTSVSKTDIELSALHPSMSINVYASRGWHIESHPQWLTATPVRSSGTRILQVESSTRYDFEEKGEIVIVDDRSTRVTINVSHRKCFDEAFAQVLQARGYIPDAAKIDLDIVRKIEVLKIINTDVTNVAGIEFFEILKELDCSKNQLTNLDLSKNSSLTYLNCYQNQLTNLNVKNNTKLNYLNCGDNRLTRFDISKDTNLKTLYCDCNQLTNLDISKNTNLDYLNCRENKLTNLNVSNNTKLKYLICPYNQLTDLEVSKNTNLTNLSCSSNKLTKLDISKNTNLTNLYCEYNPGDRNKFTIKTWFDNNSIPETLKIGPKSWTYNGNSITIDFYK